AGHRALSIPLRVPRRAARIARARVEPADRRLRRARAAPAHQLPQIRLAQRRAWRRRLELAVAGKASWPADATPRLELFAVRGDALRDRRSSPLRRRRLDLVRRLSQNERRSSTPATQDPR